MPPLLLLQVENPLSEMLEARSVLDSGFLVFFIIVYLLPVFSLAIMDNDVSSALQIYSAVHQ